MTIWVLLKGKLKHKKAAVIAIVLVCMALTIVILGMQAYKTEQARLIEAMYDDYEIRCVVANFNGTSIDDLSITASNYTKLTDKMYPIEQYCEDYVRKKELLYTFPTNTSDHDFSKKTTLFAIDSFESVDYLASYSGIPIVYFETHDEDALDSTRPICVVPESMLCPSVIEKGYCDCTGYHSSYSVGNSFMIEHVKMEATDDYCSMNNVVCVDDILHVMLVDPTMIPWNFETAELSDIATPISFRIAGYYKDSEAENHIFINYPAYQEQFYARGVSVSAESMSFALRNNRELDEFKEVLYEHFNKPDKTSFGGYFGDISVIVRDEQFLESIETATENYNMASTILPIIQVAAIIIGFVISILFVRGERRNFLLMRILGEGSSKIFLLTFVEQALLLCIGTFIGMTFCIIFYGKLEIDSITTLIINAVCYMAGCTITSFFTARQNLMIKTEN